MPATGDGTPVAAVDPHLLVVIGTSIHDIYIRRIRARLFERDQDGNAASDGVV
jgi:hypothetical protein